MTGVRRRRDRTARRLPPPPPPPPTATALVIRLLLICCASSAVAAARAVDRSTSLSAFSSPPLPRKRRCARRPPRALGRRSAAASSTTAIAASSSSTGTALRSFVDNDSISAAAPPPRRINSEHWHVWRTADELERDGISSSSRNDGSDVDDDLTRDVAHEAASILREWGRSWAGRPEFQGLLNKSSLTHEAEESIVAIRSVLSWLNGSADDDGGSPREPVVLVDVCCGKGVLSLLASYVFANDPRVSKIVMLDRSPALKWNHVDVANALAKAERRPIIETWGGCDLHDVDGVVDRLRELDAPCALVGIHLCKMLSPAFVGVANALGPERCPFLCLAPCCLPRAVLSGGTRRNGRRPSEKNKKASVIEVRQYETPKQKEERDRSQRLRNNAMQRRPQLDCCLCGDPSHSIRGCSLLPTDEDERIDVFRRAASMEPCWKCGEIGHRKADCPSQQITGKPVLIKPPAVSVDVSDVLAHERPFGEYCRRLAGTVQRDDVRLEDAGLVNPEARHQQGENWNGERKSIFIVAS